MLSSDSSSSIVSSRDSHFTSSPCNSCDVDLKDFDSGDACRLLLQLKRKGLDETLIFLLETIIETSCAEMKVARTSINNLHSQLDTLSAQVDFLMEREIDDTALRLVYAARRVIVRGFQILFPKVYIDDVVYFRSSQDGGVNWSGFKDLIREHEKLLKTECLPRWSRLADRQDEILDAYQAESEYGSSLNSTTPSVVEGVEGKSLHRVEARIGSYHVEEHIKGNFSYLLPHCEARIEVMEKIRELSDQYLEEMFDIFNNAKSIPDLIRQLQANLQDAEEMLSTLQNPFNKAGDGGSVNTHDTDQSDNTLENDPYGGAPKKDVLILRIDSMSNRLKKVLNAQKVLLDTSGLNGWVVQTTLLIMKSGAVGLIDDPLYGLSLDGSKFLETMYTTRNVPLSKEMLRSEPSRDDAARSLESILTRTTDGTAEANSRHP